MILGITRPTLCGLAVLVVVAGCGSSSPTNRSGTPTSGGAAPSQLLGTYTTKLKPSDLSNNLELHQSSPSYKLTIATSGGTNGGPAFTITNATQGVFESSSFEVHGTRVFVNQVECPAGGTENDEYAYKLTGSTLTLTMIQNQCRDHAEQIVLTSEPWRKTSG
jgi:hypothetical protein